ncbi:MAG TPA: hypothetical protein DD706_04730, partial [Nitrospiraceae bacterium]|nr:hypothetical protein [Nitrospiraceae bacterium]
MIRRTTTLSSVITHTAVLTLLLFGLFVSPAYSASSIQLTWNANNESDLAGYKIYKRTLPSQDFGQPIFSGFPNNPSSPSTTISGLNGGTTYGLIAKAFDTSGNESAPSTEAQITLTASSPPPADTTPPTVSLTAPSAGTVSGTVTVSASASDTGGVTGVQFRLQGANLGPEDTSSPYRTSWNTTTAPNGSYTLTAIARDAAGNTKTAASVTVTVNNTSIPPPPSADTTPPTVTLTTPSAGTVSGTVTVSANASDTGGVTGVQFQLQGANLGAEDTTYPFSSSWNTTTVSNGPYTLTAIARDAAGNTTTATPVTVTVSNNILLKKYDLNGDGKADLIWRNIKTGEVAGWLLNGTSVATVGILGHLPMEWAMSGVGDLNGDGKADLVWRNNTSGAVAVWLMDGLTITSADFLGSVSTSWAIQAIDDMNGDGKADLLWRNTTDGNTAIWLMNGKAIV